MIAGLGIDAAEISRFEHWHKYSTSRLKKIFSNGEIAYCLSIPAKSAERFAARFAAKEACFKAISSLIAPAIQFMEFCKYVEVVSRPNGAPELVVGVDQLGVKDNLRFFVSISHTKDLAMAVVVAERII